jgi:hydroxyacylglutathione hydrolase
MALELVTVPCLKDNFAFLLHDAATGTTALVDAPEAAPIQAALDGARLAAGPDPADAPPRRPHPGRAELRAGGAQVWGAAADAHRLPPLDRALRPGDAVPLGAEVGSVIDVPGHTRGHIAFHFPASGLVLTGDSLMAAGCGRLFEGTADEMWASLQRLAALPPDTRVCSGHDYLTGNLRFAASLEPGNPRLISRMKSLEEMRREGRLPMPSLLSEELATNPFLRAPLPEMKAAVGMQGAPDAAVFAEIRARKDRF